ncbi:MAG TPA: helix-turn-helix domain-containing protein [Candidatus Wallbacteria bacterium]|nr:helix-turn-helix domain-containing protein [Candidatus Wallbacteria bacterium]
MKHPSDESIITFLYNEAETEEIRWIESHMAECKDCALKISAMKKTINAMNGLKDEEIPIFLADKISAGFEEDERSGAGTGRRKASNLKKNDAKIERPDKSNKTASVIKNEGAAASEIMTPGELADFLKIPLAGIYDLLSDIPYLTLAGQIRFRRSSVEKWLEIREKNPVTPKHALRDLDDSPKLWRNVV